ncbi:MAG: tRNA (N(6)-L-threonylcarbamoyladenosine(37)-C(2))-methylthiotransferase MtaB [Planctomycetes bacterium]|nr:tRNA (N(6)-L-threonylcarbamoyladenosine(37)-C(2))-methylthiotransferase MtaB [Planctomycetota bacterium]
MSTAEPCPGRSRRFLLLTFGCKANQYESQAIREQLAAAGYREAIRPEETDVVILNSCGVTGRAAAGCRSAVRKAVRANPRIRLVLTGCGVDLGDAWPAAASGPALMVKNGQKHGLAAMLDAWLAGDCPLPQPDDDRFALRIAAFHGHTRAFLKIHDGCDNHCTYCAVPRARGAPQSRSPRDIRAEAARLVAAGHPEVVLTGINIGAYRHGVTEFADLVAELAEVPGLVRLRLGSVEPPQMTERLVEVMAALAGICPHVHLPLQSGSDEVLRRMGRRYDAAAFLDTVAMVKSRLRLPAITTDVIVGFPGEDAAAFAATEDVCRRAGFSRLHVFRFSPRPGTPAAAMTGSAPGEDVERWKGRLLATGRELATSFAAACVGLRERVIVEQDNTGPGGLSDRYVRVRLTETARPGQIREVTIVGAAGDGLIGRSDPPASAPEPP